MADTSDETEVDIRNRFAIDISKSILFARLFGSPQASATATVFKS
jgi:hypothetical protein